jgi:inhibitor of growth protein 3
MVQQQEHHDAAGLLDEWTNRVANLPAEIAFMQEEIEQKDRQMNDSLSIINKHDNSIQKFIKANGSHTVNPKEDGSRRAILENYDRCQILQEEKVALAHKTKLLIDKHTRWLDGHIKALQDRGEISADPDLPSLLRPQPEIISNRLEASSIPMPLGQITNSATVAHTRQPNQYTQRVPHLQAQIGTGVASSSAPASPAASLMYARQAREMSAGAANAAAKRTKLNLGVLPASSLGRQPSATPGTPRGQTPTTAGVRAGSATPKVPQKGIATNKKMPPSGSNGSKPPKKKSNLNRVKRVGTKNSPSSTNDSELSDAESGSVDEDEVATPPVHKDGDVDEEMGDDEEGGDDRKYCICQSVSYGDMVACDNEECPYEWFHWTCVGLKSEPAGTWICPVCTKANKK